MKSEKQRLHLQKLAKIRKEKGWKMPKKAKEKIRQSRLGVKMSKETKKKIGDSHRGERHWNWKGDTSISKGYKFILKPNHPRANTNGYVRESVIIMEEAMGRYIKDDECVHHINKNTLDNRLNNLKLMTKSEHAKLHGKEGNCGQFKQGQDPWNKGKKCFQLSGQNNSMSTVNRTKRLLQNLLLNYLIICR